MNTVEMLEAALELCQRLGYAIRQEWLGGSGGGGCELRGRKYVFLDMALSPTEQFELVCGVLCEHPGLGAHSAPAWLLTYLAVAREAKLMRGAPDWAVDRQRSSVRASSPPTC